MLITAATNFRSLACTIAVHLLVIATTDFTATCFSLCQPLPLPSQSTFSPPHPCSTTQWSPPTLPRFHHKCRCIQVIFNVKKNQNTMYHHFRANGTHVFNHTSYSCHSYAMSHVHFIHNSVYFTLFIVLVTCTY